MSLLIPHAKRLLQAPFRTLALSGENWHGPSCSKLAEQYARHRAEMNEAMKLAGAGCERFTSRPQRWAATASGLGWFNRFLQKLGFAEPPDHMFP